MAPIPQLQVPEYNPVAPSTFDFAPLAKLGEELKQKRLQDQVNQLSLANLAPAASDGGTAPTVFDTGSGVSYSRKGGGDYGGAIANIESGGRYDLRGPVTKTGDRAYGKYQVMGNNIPAWSQAALGRSVTPQEFLANPKLQDDIFKHRFGQYVDKYGPGGAARAWFAGEGGMNNPNAKDQLGTTVAGYERRFLGGL